PQQLPAGVLRQAEENAPAVQPREGVHEFSADPPLIRRGHGLDVAAHEMLGDQALHGPAMLGVHRACVKMAVHVLSPPFVTFSHRTLTVTPSASPSAPRS